MNLPKLTDDLNIISSLGNRPTQTAEELKQKFDEAGKIIKDYLNNTLIDALTSQLEAELDNMKKSLNTSITNLRPISGLYISTDDRDPSTIWAGTVWKKIEDVFLLCSGKRLVGKTGGNETVTINIEQLPPHTHSCLQTTGTVGSNYDRTFNGHAVENISTYEVHTGSTGGGKAIDIMPPYLAVNVWERIS